jgi:serine/threonine protein kinase
MVSSAGITDIDEMESHPHLFSPASIIYRDLKPDNIGFDVRGDVKIFDLGLAKEIDPKKKLPDGTYNLTADTGSLRYMAPEGKQRPCTALCLTLMIVKNRPKLNHVRHL